MFMFKYKTDALKTYIQGDKFDLFSLHFMQFFQFEMMMIIMKTMTKKHD